MEIIIVLCKQSLETGCRFEALNWVKADLPVTYVQVYSIYIGEEFPFRELLFTIWFLVSFSNLHLLID